MRPIFSKHYETCSHEYPLYLWLRLCQFWNARETALREFPGIPDFFEKIRAGNGKSHIEIFAPKLSFHFCTFIEEKIVQKFCGENIYVTFPGIPGVPSLEGSFAQLYLSLIPVFYGNIVAYKWHEICYSE